MFHTFIAEEVRVEVPGPPSPPGVAMGPATYTEIRFNPPPGPFMALGHLWWALLFGYVGGRLARFVYLWRTKAENE
ncbi:MAG: hypothetical protein WD669_07055 [Pirellulales bacterium]